ncbi:MAG: hypothetical protein EWM45_08370 [Rhodopseudomonas palustris]|nr:MAG: hypothetical protein EWM45_08370 [Rhodopseudomonas palustris]
MSAFQGEPSSVDAGTDAANEAKSAAQPPANSGKPAEPPLLTHQSTTDDQAERSDGKRSGTVTILSPREREWDGSLGSAPRDEDAQPSSAGGKRRIAAMAAVVAIAVIGGAAGGALGTASFTRPAADDSAAAAAKQMQTLSQEIARIDADLAALKTSADQIVKQSSAQSSKSSDRFEKLEKAQADVAAKLSKLGESVDKLKPAPVAAAPAAAAPKETTGSIAAAAPKPEVGRLPTVEGWVLREVADGGAVIEGRQGAFEVFAGDPVPGLGRVDAIRRQDGRWVVVTSRGLIVAR